jgi:putative Mg2+ transporter-C (MgtC) family protein
MEISQMILNLVVALVLGGLMGLEREIVGKEAGVRTGMTVAGGAALFSIVALRLPYLIATSPENLQLILAHNGGFLIMIANIVVGIGFLGGGIIIKNEHRVHGLTTAAVIWTTAAIGILAGIGMISFAIISAGIISLALFFLRRFEMPENMERM